MADLFIDFAGTTCLWIKINEKIIDSSLKIFDSH